jgi:DNA-binding beta-propeller fold protein YncE
VIVYRPTFAVARHWWLSGYSPHQGGLNPNAIALGGGAVYVADTRYNRVQKFSASGRLLGLWGGRTGVRFWRPYGIGVGLRGHVFVLDTGNNRVVELDGNGRVLAIWGRQGQAPGQFNQPMGLALDRRGNVYVADTRNDRIQKLVTGGHG